MLRGSVNEIAITAIISPTTIREPKFKQARSIIRQTQVVPSPHFSFIAAIFKLEPEKEKKTNFESKVSQHVRFSNKSFSSRQILKQNFYNVSDFKLKTFVLVGF